MDELQNGEQSRTAATNGASGGAVIRLTTDDGALLLPALAQAGASLRVLRGRILVRGLDADEVAFVAALHNARVADLEVLPASRAA